MRIKSVVALMCIGLILIMCGCRETREKLSGEEYFYKDEVGGDREPEMEAEEKIKQEYVREEKEISENKTVLYIYDGLNGNKTFEKDVWKRSFDRVKPRVERNGEVLYRLRGRVCDWSL